jgi:hypothetical protein
MEEHHGHLREVFRRLETAGITLNRNKVALAQREISFLRHSLSAEGIKILSDRVQAISRFPPPKTLKAVRRFLGMVGFYANFVKDFSQMAEPLHALKRKNVRFAWGTPQRGAFEKLKDSISTPPVLQVPDFSKEFVLICDSRSPFPRSSINGERRGWPRSRLRVVCSLVLSVSTRFMRRMPCGCLGLREISRVPRA